MQNTEKIFNAKIMLFGEYSLMHGSRALTIPFLQHGARLCFPDVSMNEQTRIMAIYSNKQLAAFGQFLRQEQKTLPIREIFNMHDFEQDISRGLFLESDIPSGYGLGSSGALVAAIYHGYAKNPVHVSEHMTGRELMDLQKMFAAMEAFFHGNSSGIDPLSAYTGHPLLIGQKMNLSIVRQPVKPAHKESGFFLINTGKSRKTASLIGLFNQKINHETFTYSFFNHYIPCNDRCIQSFLEGDERLSDDFKQLSRLQFELFNEMIPVAFQSVWLSGLSSGTYSLKLCGAGGGGYLLGYTSSYRQASDAIRLPKRPIIPLPVL